MSNVRNGRQARGERQKRAQARIKVRELEQHHVDPASLNEEGTQRLLHAIFEGSEHDHPAKMTDRGSPTQTHMDHVHEAW